MNKSDVTLTSIAQKAGVSIATVSRVINNSKGVNPKLKSRIEQIIEEMNYIPLKKNKSEENLPMMRIGFLANDYSDGVYSLLTKGILEATSALNIELVVYETQNNKDRETSCLNQLQNSNVNGLISVTNLSDLNPEYQNLLSHYFPIVFLRNPMDPKVVRDDLNIVGSDLEGPFYATKYLLDLGHKDILYLGDSKSPRFSGYKNALESTGNVINPDLVIYCGDTFDEAHQYITNNFVKGRVTAILASTEAISMGCWFALTEMGMKIPEDCSIIGYNNIFTNHMSLTTIAEHLVEQGKNAVYLLYECMNNNQVKPRNIVLGDSLMIRRSCSKLSL